MPAFFVPAVEPDKQEDAYQQLAALVGAVALPAGQRIYSVSWRHDGVTWTATVGETIKGIATVTKGRGRTARDLQVPRGTADTVLAIFPGRPGLIAHDGKSGYWNMPILTGEPLTTARFD